MGLNGCFGDLGFDATKQVPRMQTDALSEKAATAQVGFVPQS
jgi:hypothetical protein